MQVSGFLLILFLGFSAITASSAQAPAGTSLCDGIATRLQSNPQEDGWSSLTKGNPPYIDLSGENEWKTLRFADANDDPELVNRFISRFNPSDQLRKAWADYVNLGHLDLGSLAGSDLHVVTSTGGSALCSSFMFFETPKGRQAQLLPDVPRKSDRDGENLICSKYGGDGHLARVGGVASFVETQITDTKAYYRVVPLQNGKWSNACAVEAEYGTTYNTSKTFAPVGGPLRQAELRAAASEIVEKRERVQDAKDFSFGPPLSEAERTQVRTMMNLVSTFQDEPFPAFGREKELDAGEETLKSGDSFPVVLNGNAYLLRLGEGQLGCCYSTGPLLIFYTFKEAKLEAVGSAIVEKRRGELQSVRVRPSR